VLAQVRAGNLVALTVSGAKRSPLLHEMPTVTETGYSEFDATFSLVLFTPTALPMVIVDAMFKALDEAFQHSDMVERLRRRDQAVVADPSEASAARLAANPKTSRLAVKRIGLPGRLNGPRRTNWAAVGRNAKAVCGRRKQAFGVVRYLPAAHYGRARDAALKAGIEQP
jgi:hypothetical protein